MDRPPPSPPSAPSSQGASRRDPARPRAHPGEPCRNCTDPTPGEYCRACGQRKVEVRASLRELASDFFEDQFGIERRTPATVFALLCRPGHLTREYLEGRVVRYIRPLKLYLVSSVLLFLLVGILSARGIDAIAFGGEGEGASVLLSDDSVDGEPPPLTDSAGAETGTEATGTDAATARDEALRGIRDAWRDRTGNPEAPPVDEPATSPAAETGDRAPQRERPAWYDDVNVNTGSARLDAMIEARLRRLGRMEPAEAVQDVIRTLVGNTPTLMFLLLPLFAALYQLLYIRSGRYYAEHFVFVLHAHAFVFGAFALSILLSWMGAGFLVPFLLLWVGIYLYLALRRVYGQGHLKTAIKYWCLAWGYFWILTLALPFFLIAAFFIGG